MLRHIIRTQDFDARWMFKLFDSAREFEQLASQGRSDLMHGKIMATLFYEPSTRTRLSFEAAMHRLGGAVISTDNAYEFSSVAKGETLEDTIRVIGYYADLIVLRHDIEGSALSAAAVSTVQIINAGDGKGQHPTQALLDVYTIIRRLGGIEGVRVGFVGDLVNGRTVHSLVYLLAKLDCGPMTFISHPSLAMPTDLLNYLSDHGVSYQQTEDLRDAASQLDVFYVTRVQKKRFANPADYDAVKLCYVVDNALAERMQKDAIIMHPLPRVGELSRDVDSNPRAAYFDQAKYGVPVRMAIIADLLSANG